MQKDVCPKRLTYTKKTNYKTKNPGPNAKSVTTGYVTKASPIQFIPWAHQAYSFARA